MINRWNDGDARETVDRYAEQGVPEDLALRVYTTRLLGQDPALVLHGGGNTSAKSQVTDLTGETLEVLYVKGSGWDMATIEPPGLPAVRLEPLLELTRLERLSDEAMVNFQRRCLLDASAPNPSVETLLHAWIPHRFIDHTHADAIVTLTDQPDGEAICRDLFGDRLAIVPYIMPGFDLAQAARKTFEEAPGCEGLILLKHGIFTFGSSAREAYRRMIECVAAAEERIAEVVGEPRVHPSAPVEAGATAPAERLAPAVRGALAVPLGDGRSWQRFVLDFRSSPQILDFLAGEELERYARSGTVTPDHVIRTKPWPVILPAPDGNHAAWMEAVREKVDEYRTEYHSYFDRHNDRHGGEKKQLDTSPRVVLVPGVGLFAAGANAKAAAAAADLAEANVRVISAAEAMSRFESIDEADLFDIEYWSLEQAKLSRGAEPPLARRVVAITGGAGAIGAATARAFRAAGAEVALLDLEATDVEVIAERIGGRGFACDVTSDGSVRDGVAAVVRAFGGIDILVSNAGAAWSGRMADVEDEVLRKSFELNFYGHQRVASGCVRVMLEQGTGGCLLFNVSKQAVNPGPAFGPYGLPKTATLALVRQYAIEYGADGIRSNGVNADRIRSGLLTDDMIEERSQARGLTPESYMSGNLLGIEVTAEDVADAFVCLARSEATTGAILTVDGGNIAAALR